jgi:hypothetical protein
MDKTLRLAVMQWFTMSYAGILKESFDPERLGWLIRYPTVVESRDPNDFERIRTISARHEAAVRQPV